MQSRKKKILLLGSGMMAIGVVDYMVKRKENFITIGTNIVKQGHALAKKYPGRIQVILLNVKNEVKNNHNKF